MPKQTDKPLRPARTVLDLYQEQPYLDAYAAHTDQRVEADPHAAIGGMWEEIGNLQFGYLVNHGLRSEHRLLDLGCGTLRGGRHFIRYLDAAHYSGIDISEKALAYARELVVEEGLSDKRPHLVLNESKILDFAQFDDSFDVILAQSVFTHLPVEVIEHCFCHVGKIMHDESRFFFTFWESPVATRTGLKEFSYPVTFFEALAERHSFVIRLGDDYLHPRGQRMAVLQRLSAPSFINPSNPPAQTAP
jgi:SAM-dependent methyltransferase